MFIFTNYVGFSLNIYMDSGYLSDDGSARQRGQADMSVFRTAVEDCLDYEPETSKKPLKSGHAKSSSDVEVEKFSGLRIR